jgi:NAD(P)-dependent dehydrogenase (short-subunit alcohol dehydrogenase family)
MLLLNGSAAVVSDKWVVVTGANAGLGFAIAKQMAQTGANIVMACRSLERAAAAQRQLLTDVPGAKTRIIQLDVSEPETIRSFIRQFAEEIGQLDVLINNAGIVATPLAHNSVGHELQLATNYLGAFALTGLLLPYFRKDRPARIVNVGSLANRLGQLDLDDLNWEKGDYDPIKAYSRSKLAMQSFTMELSRRLQKSASNIAALAAHPGFAATDISRNSAALTPKSAFGKWFNGKLEKLIPSPERAARPIIYAACADTVEGGDYYGPHGLFEIAGKPGRARINPIARNIVIGKKLWAISEKMTGVNYLSES